jgi:hypothetical protein
VGGTEEVYHRGTEAQRRAGRMQQKTEQGEREREREKSKREKE